MTENKLNKEAIKTVLINNGFKQVYGEKGGKIIVNKTDAVQVSIVLQNNKFFISEKFPTIGNIVQIILTVVLIATFFLLDGSLGIAIPFPWLSAIGMGQLGAFLWFKPQIKKLKQEVEKILNDAFL